ncbi:hypothetical protein EYF80_059677 [Liparis tanakae]|uniref:Uncharacterized protein n=1 Tax=Liparis tanakae TaxID=230148 RepID=A0A4Z2EP73_9TELE|nr:hypothetical protein EYF80_059677 [Liparis tanakae]
MHRSLIGGQPGAEGSEVRGQSSFRITGIELRCKQVLTLRRMPVSLSVSQSMMIWPSFLLSRSWNTFRKEASVMVSTFTDVTSQFLSAAVRRASVDELPRHLLPRGGVEDNEPSGVPTRSDGARKRCSVSIGDEDATQRPPPLDQRRGRSGRRAPDFTPRREINGD